MEGSPTYNDANSVDLVLLMRLLWTGKLYILGMSLLGAVLSFSTVYMIPDVYTSRVILAPSGSAKGGIGMLAGQFGDLASIAGINLGSGVVDSTTVGIETLKSRAFLVSFVHRHEISIPLIAAKKWDLGKSKWIIDQTKFSESENAWVREVKPPKKQNPSDWELYKEFSQLVTVAQDKKTQIITLSVESKCPPCAKEWAEKLVADLNEHMRQKDINQAKRSMDYLKVQLENTSISEMRSVLYQLIEEQTKIIMLASVRDGYAFQVVDPPFEAEERSGPKRLIIVLGTIVAFGFLGVVIFLMKSNLHADKNTTMPAGIVK